MTIKKIMAHMLLAAAIASCKAPVKENFVLSGEIKNRNSSDTLFLEELIYGISHPEIVDSFLLKQGETKFKLSSSATEEGLFRLRSESGSYFMLVNDQPQINLQADWQDPTKYTTSSPASNSIKNLFERFGPVMNGLDSVANLIQQMQAYNAPDSLQKQTQAWYKVQIEEAHQYLIHYADTTKSPAIALFVIGMLRNQIEPVRIQGLVNKIAATYPAHKQVQKMVADYKNYLAKLEAGSMSGKLAPDFTLPDTSGKMVSLSSFTGKYVLVDFWASWCGPCRMENPNVVKAYNNFKNKNFTILGVSLDKEKKPWLKAIKDDGLSWNHVSDLKYWNSIVVDLYKFEGIPFNILVDPHGKILATNLRGQTLIDKLTEVLK